MSTDSKENLQSVVRAIQLDLTAFLQRVKNLTPLIEKACSDGGEKVAEVERMLYEGEVDPSDVAQLRKLVVQYEVGVQYAFARHQSVDERLVEASAHLNMTLVQLLQLSALEPTFDRIITNKKGQQDENV